MTNIDLIKAFVKCKFNFKLIYNKLYLVNSEKQIYFGTFMNEQICNNELKVIEISRCGFAIFNILYSMYSRRAFISPYY